MSSKVFDSPNAAKNAVYRGNVNYALCSFMTHGCTDIDPPYYKQETITLIYCTDCDAEIFEETASWPILSTKFSEEHPGYKVFMIGRFDPFDTKKDYLDSYNL